jgi:hypothetical protein
MWDYDDAILIATDGKPVLENPSLSVDWIHLRDDHRSIISLLMHSNSLFKLVEGHWQN